MKNYIFLILILTLVGCDNSKWETIEGIGIDEEPKSISQAIYFQNVNRGVVGGYELIEDSNSKNIGKLEMIPALYLTEDGGQKWKTIQFESKLRGSVNNAYLNKDTLICQIDSLVLFSKDNGKSFKLIRDKNENEALRLKYFGFNRYDIQDYEFEFDNKQYRIKEFYQNDFASLIVCWEQESLTDYYFVSYDNDKSWIFLQKDYGDNQQRFLLEDKYLLTYDWPYGLNRLRLKNHCR